MFCVLPENKGMGKTVDWRVVIGRAPTWHGGGVPVRYGAWSRLGRVMSFPAALQAPRGGLRLLWLVPIGVWIRPTTYIEGGNMKHMYTLPVRQS